MQIKSEANCCLLRCLPEFRSKRVADRSGERSGRFWLANARARIILALRRTNSTEEINHCAYHSSSPMPPAPNEHKRSNAKSCPLASSPFTATVALLWQWPAQTSHSPMPRLKSYGDSTPLPRNYSKKPTKFRKIPNICNNIGSQRA